MTRTHLTATLSGLLPRYQAHDMTRTHLDATFVRLLLVTEVTLSPDSVQTHVRCLHLLRLLKVSLLRTERVVMFVGVAFSSSPLVCTFRGCSLTYFVWQSGCHYYCRGLGCKDIGVVLHPLPRLQG